MPTVVACGSLADARRGGVHLRTTLRKKWNPTWVTMAALTAGNSMVNGTTMAGSTADDPCHGMGRHGQDKDIIVEAVPWDVCLLTA